MNSKRVWITKSGEKIEVKRLDDKHLINIIRYLEQKHAEPYVVYTGNIGGDDFEGDVDFCDCDITGCSPIYSDLIKEATRRNLGDLL